MELTATIFGDDHRHRWLLEVHGDDACQWLLAIMIACMTNDVSEPQVGRTAAMEGSCLHVLLCDFLAAPGLLLCNTDAGLGLTQQGSY